MLHSEHETDYVSIEILSEGFIAYIFNMVTLTKVSIWTNKHTSQTCGKNIAKGLK